MAKGVSKTKIAKDFTIAASAQIISIAVSFIFGFIVPKFVDEYQYAYWQTFIMYFGYIGLIPLGLIDGLILRYSQYDYRELDKKQLSGQFRILMLWACLAAGVLVAVSCFTEGSESRWILILLAISIIVHLYYAYNSNVFQITNRISEYAIFVIVQRVIYVGIVIGVLVAKVNCFIYLCCAEIAGELIAAVISSFKNKGLFFSKGYPIKAQAKETWLNVSSGFQLMIANFAANFLISGARMAIQWRWGTLVFGQVSFAFSVSNVFLTFITAISVVLFPSLKRIDSQELPNLYVNIRNVISPMLFFVLLLYFPGNWILSKWLPAYTSSLLYLGILLPIIIFSTKVNLLTNNYLKAYRKEGIMFVINLVSVAVGFGAYLFGAYVLDNLEFVLYAVVFVVMLRSVVSEAIVMKIVKKNFTVDFVVEFVMTAAFVVFVRVLGLWWACLAYSVALVLYSVVYRKRFKAIFLQLKRVLQRRKRTTVASVAAENAAVPEGAANGSAAAPENAVAPEETASGTDAAEEGDVPEDGVPAEDAGGAAEERGGGAGPEEAAPRSDGGQ